MSSNLTGPVLFWQTNLPETNTQLLTWRHGPAQQYVWVRTAYRIIPLTKSSIHFVRHHGLYTDMYISIDTNRTRLAVPPLQDENHNQTESQASLLNLHDITIMWRLIHTLYKVPHSYILFSNACFVYTIPYASCAQINVNTIILSLLYSNSEWWEL